MLKKFVFFFILCLLFLLTAEIFLRSIVYIKNKNLSIFLYGINKSVEFKIVSLSKFDFQIINYSKKKQIINLKKKQNFNKDVIWVFGGSTSDVACTSMNKSSWPSKLNQINDNFFVNNFAKTGTNSDYALDTLMFEILDKKKQKPNYIIWANYVNETDVLPFGFKKNEHLEKEIKIKKLENSFFYNLNKFFKTFKKYSVFFNFFEKAVVSLIYRMNLDFYLVDNHSNYFTDEQLKLAAKNYLINTSKAIDLSTEIGANFYILTLFSVHDLHIKTEDSKRYFRIKRIFFNEIEKLKSKYPQIYWLNLTSIKLTSDNELKKIFCDNIHFTDYGNEFVSKLVYDQFYLK